MTPLLYIGRAPEKIVGARLVKFDDHEPLFHRAQVTKKYADTKRAYTVRQRIKTNTAKIGALTDDMNKSRERIKLSVLSSDIRRHERHIEYRRARILAIQANLDRWQNELRELT